MNCAEYLDRFQLLLDDSREAGAGNPIENRVRGPAREPSPLPVPEDLAEHLATCGNCRELHEVTQRLLHGLRLPSSISPPNDFADRVVSQVLRERQLVRKRHGWLVVGLAASVLLAILGWTAVTALLDSASQPAPLVQQAPQLLAPPAPAPSPQESPDSKQVKAESDKSLVPSGQITANPIGPIIEHNLSAGNYARQMLTQFLPPMDETSKPECEPNEMPESLDHARIPLVAFVSPGR
jgi:hypothetical protein